MAESLQRSLLTQPSAAPGVQTAVRYQPAVHEAQVGGDWYDALVTREGATLLVVGDIAGHDQDAAAAMGQVRNLLRGIAYDSSDNPAVLLTRLDAALRGLELNTFATAVLARLEQTSTDSRQGVWRLRWSNAGHLPPLLRQPDGTVRVLATDPDLLLGFDPSTSRGEHLLELVEGSTLVMYTDGLVERRDASLDDGIARLAAVLSAQGGETPEIVADRLLDAMDAAGNEDDTALLVMRLQASPEAKSTTRR
jgi:serine phosphatase RsbU (regulator of sigma subunit)